MIMANTNRATEEKFNEMVEQLYGINLANVVELDDATDAKGELACAGGACEIV